MPGRALGRRAVGPAAWSVRLRWPFQSPCSLKTGAGVRRGGAGRGAPRPRSGHAHGAWQARDQPAGPSLLRAPLPREPAPHPPCPHVISRCPASAPRLRRRSLYLRSRRYSPSPQPGGRRREFRLCGWRRRDAVRQLRAVRGARLRWQPLPARHLPGRCRQRRGPESGRWLTVGLRGRVVARLAGLGRARGSRPQEVVLPQAEY